MQSTHQRRQTVAEPLHSHPSASGYISPNNKQVRSHSWPTPGNTAKRIQTILTESDTYAAGSALIDDILRALVEYVRRFRCPSELDFSFNPKNPMILASTEPNKPFINQLQKLHSLRTRLMEIPTSGDEQLEKKHRAAQMAIAQALRRMKEWQLQLYEKSLEAPTSGDDLLENKLKAPQKGIAQAFQRINPIKIREKLTAPTTKAQDSPVETSDSEFEQVPSPNKVDEDAALEKILHQLFAHIRGFEFPSELDFSASGANPMILANTEKNKPFIDQLRRLKTLQTSLEEIPMPSDQELSKKHRATGSAIRVALKGMRDLQIKLYENSVEGAQAKRVKELKETEGALDRLIGDLNRCLETLKYPSELDLVPDIQNRFALLNTERNKPFLDCLRELNRLRDELVKIPTDGDERLEETKRDISVAIGQALQEMKKHQINLFELYNKARR